jgi:hypothetical protein
MKNTIDIPLQLGNYEEHASEPNVSKDRVEKGKFE